MHIVIIQTVEIRRKHIVPMLAVQSEGSAISLLVVLGNSAVHIQRPGFLAPLGDDIDDAARSIAAVKGRSRTFHNLDALHIVHVQSGEIHIIHCLASQSLAIYQKENSLTAESGKVEMGLLIHGIRELHARQLLLKQILHRAWRYPWNRLLGSG